MRRTKVLIVDDESLIRHALRVFVESDERMEVVGLAADGGEAQRLCDRLRPDLILMDLHMPGIGGIEATAAIAAAHPETRVLVVTTLAVDRHVLAALQAGASGYLLKDTEPEALLEAIRQTVAGNAVLSPRVTGELIRAVRALPGDSAAAGHPDAHLLSEREVEVIRLLAEGLSNREIGERLHLAEGTVKSALTRVMQKWQLRDRVQVVIHAAKSGIVSF